MHGKNLKVATIVCAVVAIAVTLWFVKHDRDRHAAATGDTPPAVSPDTGVVDDAAQLRALSQDFAEKLASHGTKKILFLDFEEANNLGSWRGVSGSQLADQFSEALSKTKFGLAVLDRHRYTRALERLYERSDDSFSEPDVQSIGRAVGADTVVEGQYLPLRGKFRVTISAFRIVGVVHCIAVQVGEFAFPSIYDARALHWTVLGPPQPGAWNDKPSPNEEKPYTEPECLSCPMPSFRVDGSVDDTRGVVLLVAIITTRGRAVQIKVLHSLSPERDRQAVRVAENWTFKPATRIPGGAPLAAHASLEVTFRPN